MSNDELIHPVDSTGDTPDPAVDDHRPTASHRRAVLRGLALGGAGAAIGAITLGERASAGDSGGAEIDGNAVELGDLNNTSATPTGIAQSNALGDYSALTVWEAGNDPATIGTNIYPGLVGGYGTPVMPNGVHGSTTAGDGFGVVAANLAPEADEIQTVPPSALAVASANGPQVKFVVLEGAVRGPTAGTHAPGELYVDADGTLWFTVPVPPPADAPEGTEPGTRFVQLASTGSAGALHTLPFPARIADTRLNDGPKLVKSSTTEFDVTTLAEDGSPSGVPVGAKAALMNVTATRTEFRGYFSVSARGVDIPDDALFASGNWFDDDQNINANVTSALDEAGMIQVELGPQGDTHLVIDVVGYYL